LGNSEKVFADVRHRGMQMQMVKVARRGFLRGATSFMAGSVLAGSEVLHTGSVLAQTAAESSKYGVKALFFDVFGTLVDWRTGIAREAEAHLKSRGYTLDWLAFADAWRAEYQPGMEEVRSGRIPFSRLDVLHRRMLDRILPRFGIKDLPEDVSRSLNLAWHRLDGWSDLTPGLARLGGKFLLAPVSNGNISLMVDLARRNSLRFDAILGAEIAGDYKPKPRVYLSAVEAFALVPNECIMVCAAAHTSDLEGAAAAGLRTASIARPNEFGPGTAVSIPKAPVDVVAQSLLDLADKLGA
jgi:2-haloacid dehalogenase